MKNTFFIENPHCPKAINPLINIVEECFNCPYYAGVKLTKKKLILICQVTHVEHSTPIPYKPRTKKELKHLWEKLKEKRKIERKYVKKYFLRQELSDRW